MKIPKNLIINYLRQHNKTDKEIILELYQVLNNNCNNKSELIKELINQLLLHKKIICEDSELELNLYFILALNNVSINDLFKSKNILITDLHKQYKNEKYVNDINIRIISNIMQHMTTYLVNTSFKVKCKLLNELEIYSSNHSSNTKCKQCDSHIDCNNGLGFCSICNNNIKRCSKNGLNGCYDLKEDFAEFKINSCEKNGHITMNLKHIKDNKKDNCFVKELNNYPINNQNISCTSESDIPE